MVTSRPYAQSSSYSLNLLTSLIMTDYDYSPLAPSHIRLMKVTIDSQDELQTSIEHTSLNPEDPIAYSTLSYVWGDTSNTVQLPCDGKTISITTTLNEALRQVAKFNPNKLLWVDQICINQHNLPERSEQVKLMNTIYESMLARYPSCTNAPSFHL